MGLKQRSNRVKSNSTASMQKYALAASTDTKSPATQSSKLDIFLLSVGCILLYHATLYPSIAGGDSGELVAESCHLGISHPPGYPLFNMLVHLVTRIPIALSPAWKANMFSAGCDTICAIFIYLSIMRWTKRYRVAALTAAGMFAFSPLIWTYAVGAEVFSLNNMFGGLLMYILLLYADTKQWKYVCMGAFCSGIAMCNQHTIILFEIPIIFWVLWTQRNLFTWRKLGQLTFCYLLGLLPYVYMPISATFNPQDGSWGQVTTFEGFFHHLRRADYGTFKLFSTNKQTEGLQTRLQYYFRDFTIRESLYIGTPLLVLGIVTTCALQRSFPQLKHVVGGKDLGPSNLNTVGYLMLGMYLFYLIGFHALANLPLSDGLLYGVHMRFWQQPNILAFIWVGIGLDMLLYQFNHFVSNRTVQQWFRVIIGLGLVGGQVSRWIELCDQHEAWYIHNYAKALVDPLPTGALYLANYDLQWTAVRYLQRCEGFRTDVTFINLSMMTYQWFLHKHVDYPKLMFPGTHLVPSGARNGGFSMKQFIDANYKVFRHKGIYIGGKLNYDDADFKAAYTFLPFGLLNRFVPIAKVPSLDKWYWKNHRIMNKVHSYLPILPDGAKYGADTWEYTIARDYQMHRVEQATYLLDKVIEKNASLALLIECAKPLEYSLKNEPKEFYSDHLLKNLGLAYAYMVKSNEQFQISEGNEPFEDYIGNPNEDKTNYKNRASQRMLQIWSEWLQTSSAVKDPAFETIKGIVNKFK